MFKKIGISLMAALMMSSVAFAWDYSVVEDGDSIYDFSLTDEEYLECCFSLVDNGDYEEESN